MIVEALSPAAYPEWDAYVDGRPEATCYQLRGWKEIAEGQGEETRFLIAREAAGGRVCGVLPLYLHRRPFLRTHLSSGIFGAHGGIVSDGPEVARALLAEAKAIAEREDAEYLRVRALSDPLLDGELTRVEEGWVLARMALDPDPEVVWKGLEPRVRRFIKSAQRHGLEVRVGPGQVPALWEVYAQVLHRLGSMPQGLSFLSTVVRALGSRAEVLTLHHQGEPIAASLVCNFHGVICDIFGASLDRAFHMRPNHLLYWEVIQRGIAQGMRVFEIGTSFPDSGVNQFQASWGSRFENFPQYFHLRRGGPPGPPIPRFMLGKLIKPLPNAVSRFVGPRAARFFGDF